jgi:hypothetical protein
MPVAIGFSCYALWTYIKRTRMLLRRDPGPYDDMTGPIALSIILAIAIIVNFFAKLYDFTYGYDTN